jgi:hypothetical protein
VRRRAAARELRRGRAGTGEWEGERERDGLEASSPRRGAPAVVVRRWGAREAVVRGAPEARATAKAPARVCGDGRRRLRLGTRAWVAAP